MKKIDGDKRQRGKVWRGVGVFRSFVLLFGLLGLVMCADAGAGDPADTVERFLEAKVAGDEAALRGLMCAEREADVMREAQTFATVQGVRLEGVACRATEDNRVRCEGEIVAVYGSEETTFPLTNYRVVQEAGEWKWCGEAP